MYLASISTFDYWFSTIYDMEHFLKDVWKHNGWFPVVITIITTEEDIGDMYEY